jgi:phosphoribosylanthranilate isomerase
MDAGANLIGLVRFPRSPRHLDLQRGSALSEQARGRVQRVLLVVDPSDRELDEDVSALDPDLIQLHGGETPERVEAVRRRTGRPVMKAIGVGNAADLDRISDYRGAADRILLDAKPPQGAVLPGGNGVAFDWSLLGRLDPSLEFMLSGGLTPYNVGHAILTAKLRAIDVSSGVEDRPGEKSPAKIAAFVAAARAAFAAEDRTEP